MNFLVDAQLPRRISSLLNSIGHNSVHTLDLPLGNRTPDRKINEIALNENRAVITKDADFVESLVVNHMPPRLLLISTGNINNAELEILLSSSIESMVRAFEAGASFVELNRTPLIVHF